MYTFAYTDEDLKEFIVLLWEYAKVHKVQFLLDFLENGIKTSEESKDKFLRELVIVAAATGRDLFREILKCGIDKQTIVIHNETGEAVRQFIVALPSWWKNES